MLADPLSPWNALADPAWFACPDPETVADKARQMGAWPSFPALEDQWTQAVIKAMGVQDTVWGQLLVFHALEETDRRNWPLAIKNDGKDMTWSALGAPQWLQDLRTDMVNKGAEKRAEREMLSLECHRLMGATSPASYRDEVVGKVQRTGLMPMFQGARLPVALLIGLRGTLSNQRFRGKDGKVRSQSEGRRSEMNARWLRGLLRWVDQDATGSTRDAALVVGWAAAQWFHRNERVQASGNNRPSSLEESLAHYQTAIDLAQKLLAKTGLRTPEDYRSVTLWALNESPWGNALKTTAAETIAMSWGTAWGPGSEEVWVQSLKQLAGEPETHWNHFPVDCSAEVPGRHIIRNGISAVTDHLAAPTLFTPEEVLVAMERALEPRWITEALSQVWLSSQSHPGTSTVWGHCVEAWLSKAPPEEVHYWPIAIEAAWRQQDGERSELVATAREQILQAQLVASEHSVSRRPRTRL